MITPEINIIFIIGALLLGSLLLYLLYQRHYRILVADSLQKEEESRRIRTELEEAIQRSEQAEQLKSAFLSNINHEIRTPLNAIVGFSDLITEEEDTTVKKQFSEIIHSNCNQLLYLIEDILNLSRLQSGAKDSSPEWFDLSAHFETIASTIQNRIPGKQVSFICKNPYPRCMVKMDKKELTQIITKYVIYSSRLTSSGFIELGYEREKEGIRIYVTDSGIGLKEEQLPRVFDWYYQDSRSSFEMGLEMPLCKAIVESHGGEVGVRSRWGSGSTYWAWIPCEVEA